MNLYDSEWTIIDAVGRLVSAVEVEARIEAYKAFTLVINEEFNKLIKYETSLKNLATSKFQEGYYIGRGQASYYIPKDQKQ